MQSGKSFALAATGSDIAYVAGTRSGKTFAKQASPEVEAPKAAAQPLRMLKNGGYRVLTATRGWKTFAGKRLQAQFAMAAMFDVIAKRMGPRWKVGATPNRYTPHQGKREMARRLRQSAAA